MADGQNPPIGQPSPPSASQVPQTLGDKNVESKLEGLYKATEKLNELTQKHASDIREQKGYLLLGFIFALLMVALYMLQAAMQLVDHYTSLNDNVLKLQWEIEQQHHAQ